MNELTLNELCRKYGVTRRAVQGYEKHGLVRATGKTNRGYLLYDYEAQMKIVRIKKYQSYGFTVAEIRRIFDTDDASLRTELLEKQKILSEKQDQIEKAISDISDEIGKIK